MAVGATSLFLFIGFCILFGALACDIKHCLAESNGKAIDAHSKFTASEHIEFVRSLKDIIQLHADVKE